MYVDFKKAYANKAAKEFDRGVKLIKPTIFNKDYQLNTNAFRPITDDINTRIIIEQDKLKGEKFVKIHPYLLSDLLGKGESIIAVLAFIIKKLQYNSNCIHATTNEIAKEQNISVRIVKEAIDYLCVCQVIAKTTIQSEYIINHNLIFKGDIMEFVKAYNKLYDKQYAQKDSKGRIILSRDIVNIEKNNRWIEKRNIKSGKEEINNKVVSCGDNLGDKMRFSFNV